MLEATTPTGAVLDQRRQGFHDEPARTFVVYDWADEPPIALRTRTGVAEPR